MRALRLNGAVLICLREAKLSRRESPDLRQKRAIPLYWCLLPKLGSSNLQELTLALEQVLPLFKKYKVIVLGDGVGPRKLREFCSVDARILPQDNGCIFLFKAEKKLLPGNRKLNLATFRPIRSHAVELRYIFA